MSGRLLFFRLGLSESTVTALGQAVLDLGAGLRIEENSAAHHALGVLVDALNDGDPRSEAAFAVRMERAAVKIGEAVLRRSTRAELLEDPSTPFWALEVLKRAHNLDPVDYVSTLHVLLREAEQRLGRLRGES